MSASSINLLQQAAQLPRRARAELAQHLIESIDDSSEPAAEVAKAWIVEAEAAGQPLSAARPEPILLLKF